MSLHRRALRIAKLWTHLASTSGCPLLRPEQRLNFTPRRFATIRRAAAKPQLPDDDARLINLSDFVGIRGTTERPVKKSSPEVDFSVIEQHLRQNFRISADALFCNFLHPLEQKDDAMRAAFRKHHERWLPVFFRSCGRPMSNVSKQNKNIILQRLLAQIDELGIRMTTPSFNAYLATLLENDVEFSVDEMIEEAEQKRKIELDQESFRRLLERLAYQGQVDAARHLVYEMAKRGFMLDAECNAAIIFGFAVRGFNQKADSLFNQTSDRYGAKGVQLAHDALAQAAASRGDLSRLKKVLNGALSSKNQLALSNEGFFNTIWRLAESSDFASRLEVSSFVEKMLDQAPHNFGYFKLLSREIECHIAHCHYYTALNLLEDTIKVHDFLKKQRRLLLIDQMQTRMCRQLIRTETSISKVKEIANRTMAVLRRFPQISNHIYDELLKSALTFREFDVDKKFEYFLAFIDAVDPERERVHLTLPLLASCPDTTARLRLMFRCETIGYKDIAQLDSKCLAALVLQPLYNLQKARRRLGEQYTRLMWAHRVMKSYGFSEKVLWRVFYNWWNVKLETEKRQQPSEYASPTSYELSEWLKKNYERVFEAQPISKQLSVEPTYKTLKALVDATDATNVHAFIASYGWPEDTDFEAIVPKIFDLYLEHLDWANMQVMLKSLSGNHLKWISENDKTGFSPLKNYHLIRLLRERLSILIMEKKTKAKLANDEETTANEDSNVQKLIVYCYELRRLFPNAVSSYDTFFETITEYKQLFNRCFSEPNLTMEHIDDCIELLRTLIKLGLVTLHANETLTITIVDNVLMRFGWLPAVNVWMSIQSGFYSSNGIISLLKYALRGLAQNPQKGADLQYVLHKAQNFVPASRVHALYAAVLVSLRKYDDAEAYIKAQNAALEPLNIVSAFRLMNVYFKQVDEDFAYNFCRLMLQHSQLKSDLEACAELQRDWLRLCETRKLGRFALRLYALFDEFGVVLPTNERSKVLEMAEQQDKLIKQWLLQPNGLLKLSEDDPIVKDSEYNVIYRNIAAKQSSTDSTVA